MDSSGISYQPEFDRLAKAISERAAEVLRARICVTDELGVVVASNDADLIGKPSHDGGWDADGATRVPLRLEARGGEVIVAEPLDGAEVVPPRLAHALVDLVVYQVAVVDRLPNQHELKNKLIFDLLHGDTDDEVAILRQANLLGIDLIPPRAVILVDAVDYIRGTMPGNVPQSEVTRRSQLVVSSVVRFFQLPDDTICASAGDGEVAVLKASDSKNLESWVDQNDDRAPLGPSWANLAALKRAGRALLTRLRQDTNTTINIGIGRYHPRLHGLARSYVDARTALSLGRCFHGQNRVHCLDELGIAAFVGLADARTKLELASHLLSPLDHEPALITTLETFFADNCCPSSAANRLHIHRNTLGYRLDKIASMTGLDPRRFDDAVQIRLALLLLSLGNGTR